MNLTDNEIIKALECCRDCKCKDCPCYNKKTDGCKELDEQDILDLINRKDKVIKLSAKETVDLKIKVKEKQAEIERLTDKIDQQAEMMANLGVELTAMRSAANSYKLQYEKAQVVVERLENSLAIAKKELKRYTKPKQEVVNEAIKAFAERLKEEFKPDPNYEKAVNFTIKLFRNFIDNLVKEMVGEEK